MKTLIHQEEPVSEDDFSNLLKFKEETLHLDFKRDFDCTNREWCKLMIDVMSFANSEGGILVFGVANDHSLIGIDDMSVLSTLSEVNNVNNKVNKYLTEIVDIRCQSLDYQGKPYVIWRILPLRDSVVFAKVSENDPGNKRALITRGVGMYRKIGGNEFVNGVFIRRKISSAVSLWREAFLEKADILSRDVFSYEVGSRNDEGDKFVRFTSDPHAQPVKGVSFSIPPSTDMQKVLSHIALRKGDRFHRINDKVLYEAYKLRREVNDKIVLFDLLEAFLLSGKPSFYWSYVIGDDSGVRNLVTRLAQQGEVAAMSSGYLHAFSSQFGKRTFESIGKQLPKERYRAKQWPGSPDGCFSKGFWRRIEKSAKSKASTYKEVEKRVDELVDTLCSGGSSTEESELLSLDYYLYGRKPGS